MRMVNYEILDIDLWPGEERNTPIPCRYAYLSSGKVLAWVPEEGKAWLASHIPGQREGDFRVPLDDDAHYLIDSEDEFELRWREIEGAFATMLLSRLNR